MVLNNTIYYVCIAPNSGSPPPNSNWQNASYYTLYDSAATWPVAPLLSSNYQVRIVSGTGAGQVRTITIPGNSANLLTVTPSWAVPPDDGTSVYEIGWANTGAAKRAAGAAERGMVCAVVSGPCAIAAGAAVAAAAAAENRHSHRQHTSDSTANWIPNNLFQGKYVYAYTPGAGPGQARAIVSNTRTPLP